MTNIYDREEWLNLVRENRLWISDISPNKAYDRFMRLQAEWDKYKGYGWFRTNIEVQETANKFNKEI
jgi:hypothetical protein